MVDFENEYKQAKDKYNEKKYDEALLHINRALRTNPKSKDAQLLKGNILLTMGKTDEALSCFTIATRLDPDDITAWSKKEAAHLLRGDYDEAVKCLDEVTRIQPEDENAWLNKGGLLLNLRRYKSAIDCFNKALAINPDSTAKYKKEEAIKMLSGKTSTETKKIVKKICLLGDGAVGKTSLIRRFVYDIFDDKYLSTIGAKITKKILTVKKPSTGQDIILTFIIWDIAGQQDYAHVHSTYYQGAEGALIICDKTRKETLHSLPNWIDALRKVTSNVPFIFIGNKEDLKIQAEVTEEDMKILADRYNTTYLFTSAKTGVGVEEAFLGLGQLLLKKENLL